MLLSKSARYRLKLQFTQAHARVVGLSCCFFFQTGDFTWQKSRILILNINLPHLLRHLGGRLKIIQLHLLKRSGQFRRVGPFIDFIARSCKVRLFPFIPQHTLSSILQSSLPNSSVNISCQWHFNHDGSELRLEGSGEEIVP